MPAFQQFIIFVEARAKVPGIDMKQIYLLSTEHLEKSLWFRQEEDFKVAMNHVAIEAAHQQEVSVLAFILMSNHVHFVLKGYRLDIVEFLNNFKRRYSMYYSRKYGVKEFLRRNNVDVKPILDGDEAVEKAIAYVQMNCVAAGICAHPSQYQWGTGNTFFNQLSKSGRSLSCLSKRALKRLLHSEESLLPGSWLLSDNGFIIPSSYVDVVTVEAIFRKPQRMNYFLNSSSKAKKRLESSEKNLPAFKDQSILAVLPDLCRSLFQKKSFQELSAVERTEFARQIRYRFSADATQIARVCGISYAEAAKILD